MPYLLFFLLFILPFVVWPYGTSQFELPKVIIFELSSILLLLYAVYQKRFAFFKSLNPTQLVLFGMIFLLTLYDLLFMPTPVTFFGNSSRLQGVLLLWNLLVFSLVSSRIPPPKLSSCFYFIILFSIFILSLFIGNQTGRAIATIGEPNALASYIVFLWPFIFFSKPKIRAPVQILCTICVFGVILLSGSRSGLIALAIQIIFLSFYRFLKFSLRTALIVSISLIFLACLLPLLERLPYENRSDIWNTAIIAGSAHPILGAGFGNTEIIIKETSLKLYDRLRGYYVDSAHNIFLDWWVQAGAVGLFLFILIIYGSFKNFYQQKGELEITILLGLITALSFNPAGVVTLITFWWTIGRSFVTTK